MNTNQELIESYKPNLFKELIISCIRAGFDMKSFAPASLISERMLLSDSADSAIIGIENLKSYLIILVAWTPCTNIKNVKLSQKL